MEKNSYNIDEYVLHNATKWLWKITKREQGIQKIFYLVPLNTDAPSYWASEISLNQHFSKIPADKVELFYADEL